MSVKLLAEGLGLLLQLLAGAVVFPALAKDVFDASDIGGELAFHLTSPHNRAGELGDVTDGGHASGRRGQVLGGEFFVECENVLLDALDQRRLVLLDGATDLGANKERIETAKHAEHFGRALGRGKTVT